MTIHESHYQHWDGQRQGIWRRRAVITWHGLKSCLQNKWMRHIVTVSWGFCLAQIAFLFLIGQLLVTDSLANQYLPTFSRQVQFFASALVTWLQQHPEISVRTTQNLLFYFFSSKLMFLGLAAIALAMPHLISRDLSSRAIIIYSSKAVGRLDYLLGKGGTLVGLLALTWAGPVLVAWLAGNLLSPKWHFFWHSRLALGHMLSFMLVSMLFLSVLGLGVSALSGKEKIAMGMWMGLWFLGNSIAEVAQQTQTNPWLKYFSFRNNLDTICSAIFQLKKDFILAQQNIPIFGDFLRGAVNPQTMDSMQNPDLFGALAGLGVMLVLAAGILFWRVKPE